VKGLAAPSFSPSPPPPRAARNVERPSASDPRARGFPWMLGWSHPVHQRSERLMRTARAGRHPTRSHRRGIVGESRRRPSPEQSDAVNTGRAHAPRRLGARHLRRQVVLNRRLWGCQDGRAVCATSLTSVHISRTPYGPDRIRVATNSPNTTSPAASATASRP
jgi:hypothetical protein